MHTRVFSSFFFISLSLFPLLFRDRRPLPPSQALSPSLSPFLVLFLRNTHATSTLERCSSAPPFTPRCSLENPTLFQPGRPMGAPAPAVSASAYVAFFVIRHSTGSKFHSRFLFFSLSLSSLLFLLRREKRAVYRFCERLRKGRDVHGSLSLLSEDPIPSGGCTLP